jgi:hypothetical protein
MFIGHYALGFGAKRVEPRLPLAILLAAPQLLDLLWPIFVLGGVERVEIAPGSTAFTPLSFTYYPWSHSLLMALVYAAVVGALGGALGLGRRGAVIAGGLVASHWLLDFVSHGPDMPLWPGGLRVGLGLWRSVPATLGVEIALYAAGLWLYARSTRAEDRTGTVVLVALAAFLFLVYVANALGPPPPSSKAVAASALALWVIPLTGAWIDKHRVSTRGGP